MRNTTMSFRDLLIEEGVTSHGYDYAEASEIADEMLAATNQHDDENSLNEPRTIDDAYPEPITSEIVWGI
jgi:predicted RNase H-like HicB family nuclease